MIATVSIEKLKAELAQHEAKKNQLVGKRDTLLDRLKKEYGLTSFGDAEAKLKELEALEKEQQAEYDKLKKEYENVGS